MRTRTRGTPDEEWEAALNRERHYAAYNGLTASQVAEILEMTAAEVNRLRKTGALHGINTRDPGKRPQYRFLRSEIEAFRERDVSGDRAELLKAAASLRGRAERLQDLADQLEEAARK